MPLMVMFPAFAMPPNMLGPVSLAPLPASPAPAPTDTKVKKEAADPASGTTAGRTPPGAGLPAALVALLRNDDSPFCANEVYSVPPSQPLAAIAEDTPAPEWYAITRGRFVGVVDQ
jgi:hypothetical protein